MSVPGLSVVLATPGPFQSVARTVSCLAEQTVADRLELVLAVPSKAALGELPALERLHSARVVEVGPFERVATGNAAGSRGASAEVVAFAEDHSFPGPGWAKALIDRHREPWAAVGPAVRNANPATAVSWGDFLLGYGPFADPVEGGEVDALPGHNSSYKRSVLMAFGSELEDLLAVEWVLHQRLRAAGERLFLEPRAVTAHVNFALLGSWLRNALGAGRGFARARASEWSAPRRAAFALASPVIPLVRLRRALADLRRIGAGRAPRGVRPLLLAGLAADGLGQGLGYLAPGRGGRSRLDEFDRLDHVPPAERRALQLEAR